MKDIDLDYLLPCDVLLGPGTVIRKGCKLATLLEALHLREGKDWSRFCLADAEDAIAAYRVAMTPGL